eukprot:CAMPEP_0170487712 /NCGR_PEP_ID=MMETSP0208-20121228/6464_1 /TAXON_ID=197538 /ORGANISM="Strombidium inclinatum, Strain S3" /LENGTH=104 /DNA_ID=CAMNT_0010762081 /DNA_START=1044 /DNA_END=1358 /DNA_ORIENTATION=-
MAVAEDPDPGDAYRAEGVFLDPMASPPSFSASDEKPTLLPEDTCLTICKGLALLFWEIGGSWGVDLVCLPFRGLAPPNPPDLEAENRILSPPSAPDISAPLGEI